jgi:hypothetical protein
MAPPAQSGYAQEKQKPFAGDHPMKSITTIGIDRAKNSFTVYGVNARGKPVMQRTLARAGVIRDLRAGPYMLWRRKWRRRPMFGAGEMYFRRRRRAERLKVKMLA